MPINSIAQGEVFTVRIYKRLEGQEWANSYEVQATDNSSDPAISIGNLRNWLVGLERSIHLTDVFFDRITISTYQPDSQPYDPTRFTSFPIFEQGQRARSGDALSLAICLFVRREPGFGRAGKLLYRGALQEADVAGYRSGLLTASANSLQNAINTAWSARPQFWRLVMASGTPTPQDVREVLNLRVSALTVVKKLDNRYFDRAAP
jgi:hypothetical protein